MGYPMSSGTSTGSSNSSGGCSTSASVSGLGYSYYSLHQTVTYQWVGGGTASSSFTVFAHTSASADVTISDASHDCLANGTTKTYPESSESDASESEASGLGHHYHTNTDDSLPYTFTVSGSSAPSWEVSAASYANCGANDSATASSSITFRYGTPPSDPPPPG